MKLNDILGSLGCEQFNESQRGKVSKNLDGRVTPYKDRRGNKGATSIEPMWMDDLDDVSMGTFSAKFPKFVSGGASDKDFNMYKNYASNGEGTDLSEGPFNHKALGMHDIPNSPKAQESIVSKLKSDITKASGFGSDKQLVPRWTNWKGGITTNIIELLKEASTTDLTKLEANPNNSHAGSGFDWNALRKGIEGIFLNSDIYDKMMMKNIEGGYINNGRNALKRYRTDLARFESGDLKKSPTFKTPLRPTEWHIPFSIQGKDGQTEFPSLASFFANQTVRNLQETFIYTDRLRRIDTRKRNGKAVETNSDYLSTLGISHGMFATQEIDSTTSDETAFGDGNSVSQIDREHPAPVTVGGQKIQTESGHSAVWESFNRKVSLLNEDSGVGRGRTLQGGSAIKKKFEDAMKFVSYDVLNRSTHHILQPEKYNFNNFYTLDLRLDTDALLTAFIANGEAYDAEFMKIYKEQGLEVVMKKQLKNAYLAKKESLKPADGAVKNHFGGAPAEDEDSENELTQGEFEDTMDVAGNPVENKIWYDDTSIDDILGANPVLKDIYAELPVISVYKGADLDSSGKAVSKVEPAWAIKPQTGSTSDIGFTEYLIEGLTSAIKGHVPQGVTIEEIMNGEFSRKAISPDQGTFINKVKDPTSNQPFTFRSDDPKTLQVLHEIIMGTFRSPALNQKIPELIGKMEISAPKQNELLLYMKQEDFHNLEKGGQGMSTIAKGVMDVAASGHQDIDW